MTVRIGVEKDEMRVGKEVQGGIYEIYKVQTLTYPRLLWYLRDNRRPSQR